MLNKNGTEQAFNENVATEIQGGKPQRQAVAIAYSVQRRATRAGLPPGRGGIVSSAMKGKTK